MLFQGKYVIHYGAHFRRIFPNESIIPTGGQIWKVSRIKTKSLRGGENLVIGYKSNRQLAIGRICEVNWNARKWVGEILKPDFPSLVHYGITMSLMLVSGSASRSRLLIYKLRELTQAPPEKILQMEFFKFFAIAARVIALAETGALSFGAWKRVDRGKPMEDRSERKRTAGAFHSPPPFAALVGIQ